MTVRTATTVLAGPAPRDPCASSSCADRELDEALEHISDLAERLWAVRRVHRAVASRSLLGARRLRCGGCGQPAPCPTLRAVGPA